MAVKVVVHYKKDLIAPISKEETFAFFSDFEKNIPRHFNGLERFEKAAEGEFDWCFEKIGHSGYEFQIQFRTHLKPIEFEKIEITTIPGKGNSELNGHWSFESQGENTRVTFEVQIESELPIPKLFKAVAAPFAEKGLTQFFDRYLSNVEKDLQ